LRGGTPRSTGCRGEGGRGGILILFLSVILVGVKDTNQDKKSSAAPNNKFDAVVERAEMKTQ